MIYKYNIIYGTPTTRCKSTWNRPFSADANFKRMDNSAQNHFFHALLDAFSKKMKFSKPNSYAEFANSHYELSYKNL